MAPALQRFATSVPSWNADDVAQAIHDARARAGLFAAVDEQRIRTRPSIVLAYWLRQVDLDDHPRLPHLAPEDLRCNRPDCDHGWVTVELVDEHGHASSAVRRCAHCRPGAWPSTLLYEDLEDLWRGVDDEPPF